jgi:hypothetical protein
MKQLALLFGKIFVFTAIPFGLAVSACYIIPSFLLYLLHRKVKKLNILTKAAKSLKMVG